MGATQKRCAEAFKQGDPVSARSAFAGGVQRGLYASALKRSAREQPDRATGSAFAPDADRARVIAPARAVWAPLFWQARAEQSSCVARWRRRGRPIARARRDRHRAVRACADMTANGGRRGRGSWRAYTRRAGILRTRSLYVGRVDLEIDGAVENEPEHEAFGEDAGAAEHAPHRHHAKLREQFADELGIQAGGLRVANAGIENTTIRPYEGTMGWRRRPAKHFIRVDRDIAAGATSGRPIPRTHKAGGDSKADDAGPIEQGEPLPAGSGQML
jgi:hypothetical protein